MLADSEALDKVAAGLLAVHILWLAAFLFGNLSLLVLKSSRVHYDRPFESGLDFIVATALGLSAVIGGEYLLGTFGLFNWPACSFLYLIVVAGLSFYLRRSGMSTIAMFKAIVRPLNVFRSRAILLIYLLAIIESAPAILPPVAWDSTMYHLPNAINWAHAGRIYADEFLRIPYFAYNFELLYALMFSYHLDRFVLFIGWLPFVCSAFAIQLATANLLSRFILPAPAKLRESSIIGLAAAIAFLASPLVLRYAVSGYVDVGIGFFLLATTMTLLRSFDEFETYAIPAAIIGGILVGMKLQLIAYIPILLVGLAYSARASKSSTKAALIPLLVLVGCAAPWYIRNAVLTGDPISPILNYRFGHTDPIFSRLDYEGIQWNLHQGVGDIFTAPINFALNEPFLDEAGTSWEIATIGLMPLAPLLLLIMRRAWHVDREILFLSSITGYSVLIIALVSLNIERYTLTYFALLLVTLSVGVTAFIKAFVRRVDSPPWMTAATSTALTLLLALPSPIAAATYQPFLSQMESIKLGALSPEQYIADSAGGLREANDLARLVASAHVSGNVLAVGFENTAYYFRAQGITAVGDWFGPGRYADLESAIKHKMIGAYFKRFNIDAVMIGSRNIGWSVSERNALIAALHHMGFLDFTIAGDDIHELLRPDVASRASSAIFGAVARVGRRRG